MTLGEIILAILDQKPLDLRAAFHEIVCKGGPPNCDRRSFAYRGLLTELLSVMHDDGAEMPAELCDALSLPRKATYASGILKVVAAHDAIENSWNVSKTSSPGATATCAVAGACGTGGSVQ